MPDTLLEDIELVGRSAAGDQDAFAELFDRHAPRVLGALTAFAGSQKQTEATLIEAFVRAWNEVEGYDPDAQTPGDWLLTVARSEAHERLGHEGTDTPQDASGGEGSPAIEAPSESVRRKTLWRISRQSNAASLPLAIGLSAALVAVLLGLLSWGTMRETALKRQVAALAQARGRSEASVKVLRRELAVGQTEVARLRLVARIMGSKDLVSTRLLGRAPAEHASAHVFVDGLSGEAVFFSRGLPPLPAGKRYQLWYSPGQHVSSGGTFSVDRGGGAILIIDGIGSAARVHSWRVTLERSGGAGQPSGPVFLGR